MPQEGISRSLASRAQLASQQGRPEEAVGLYYLAAQAEEQALKLIEGDKLRTIGILAVSTASLYYKSERPEEAKRIADQYLALPDLPAFARQQLTELVRGEGE